MLKILTKVLLTLGLFTLSACSDSKSNKEEVKKEYKKPPYDYRLDNYEYGKVWYDTSDIDYESSYNLGVLYHKKIKDYKTAEFWYLKSWSKKKDNEIAFNIAGLYELLKNYDNAEVFYKASYDLGDKNALYNNGVMFEKIKEYKKAKYWYKKAIEREY